MIQCFCWAILLLAILATLPKQQTIKLRVSGPEPKTKWKQVLINCSLIFPSFEIWMSCFNYGFELKSTTAKMISPHSFALFWDTTSMSRVAFEEAYKHLFCQSLYKALFTPRMIQGWNAQLLTDCNFASKILKRSVASPPVSPSIFSMFIPRSVFSAMWDFFSKNFFPKRAPFKLLMFCNTGS